MVKKVKEGYETIAEWSKILGTSVENTIEEVDEYKEKIKKNILK